MPSQNPSNKRIFPRYRQSLDCILDLSGRKFNAKLKDLSIGGMGIFIQDVLDIPSSTPDISVNTLGLEITGKIIWTRNDQSGTQVGVQQAGPLKGSMNLYRLADLLIGLQKMGKTGILLVETPVSMNTIYFRNGNLIFATVDDEDREIGNILHRWGKITPEEYSRFQGVAGKNGQKEWTELIKAGQVKPEVLHRAVHHLAEKTLLELFHLEQGFFQFREEAFSAARVITLPLNMVDLIYRGVKTIHDERRIRNSLPGMKSIVYRNPERTAFQGKITLDDHEKKALFLADGTRTIQEIVRALPLSEAEALRIMCALLQAQVVEIGEDEGETVSPGFEHRAEPGMPEADREPADKIEYLYHELGSLGYHGILNVSRNAPADEIKSAYYRMAREFHPDRYLHLQSDELREKLNAVFAYITEAYRALTSAEGSQAGPAAMSATMSGTDRNRETARKKFDEGLRFFEQDNFDEAFTVFGQAAYLDASVPDYHYYFGLLLFRNNKMKDAEASIRKALQLDPYNADYIAELGHIYLSLGFETRAKNAFEKALKFSPAHKRASDGLKKIKL